MNYRFIKVSSYYPTYLEYFYKKNINIPEDYNSHLQLILNDFFSYGDSFSRYLGELGNETYEIIYNDERLQKKWAYLNGLNLRKNWQKSILLEQLKRIKPDIIYWNSYINEDIIKLIKILKSEVPTIKVNFSNIGVHFSHYGYFREFNFVISCLKSQTDNLYSKGIDAYFIKHGFYPNILDKIKINKKSIDFSFFGSIISGNGFHYKRAEYLEYLLKNTHLESWSDFKNPSCLKYFKRFAMNSVALLLPIFKKLGFSDLILPDKLKFEKIKRWRNKGKLIKFPNNIVKKLKSPIYGLEMFQEIANSKISFNIHIDAAKKEAANFRMYEVTGVGTCLLTDWKEDIGEYFEPDYEIVTYKSKDEVLKKVNYLLNNSKEREKIAINGQRRTLKDHNLKKRVEKVNEIILKYL
ncbi:MAG: glycosyltransferase family 1 protein [Candidatus Atribacteria bacterium]